MTEQSPTTSSAPPNGSPAPGIDPLLRDFLASRDAICPVCRYDLRGATTNRCPECGHTLALSLGGYQRLPLWWYLGFAGPVAIMGFHILLIIGLVYTYLWRGLSVWYPWMGWIGMTILVNTAIVIAWTRWGYTVLHIRPYLRAAAIIGGWALGVLFLYSLFHLR